MSFITDMDKKIERCLSYFLDPLDTLNTNSIDVKYKLMFFLEHVLERELYHDGKACEIRTELKQWDIGRYYVFASGYEYLPETKSKGQLFAHIIPIHFKDDYINYLYGQIKYKIWLAGLERVGVSRYYYDYVKDNKDVIYKYKDESQILLYPQFYISENYFTPEAFAKLQQVVRGVKEEFDIREIRPTYITGRAWTEENQERLNEARKRFNRVSDEQKAKLDKYRKTAPARNYWVPKIGTFAEDRDEQETGRRDKMWKEWQAFKNS